MADIAETSEWADYIYELATTDLVLGGTGGPSNIQATQLANRTQFLKSRLNNLIVVDTIDGLSDIQYPDSTMIAFVKDSDLGGMFNYSPSLSSTNDGYAVINGWVRQQRSLSDVTIDVTTSNISAYLDVLYGMTLEDNITINLASGIYEFDETISLNLKNGNLLNISGATPIVATISSGTPTVTPVPVAGNRYTYSTVIPVVSANGFSIGDWAIVKTTGTDLLFTSYDETANGVRHHELNGFFEIVGVNTTGTHTITLKIISQQDPAHFPGAGTIAASMANFSGGTITKLPTIFKFNGCSGFKLESDVGLISDIGIVGDRNGSSTSGISISTSIKQISVALDNVGISSFTASGLNADGTGITVQGDSVYSAHNSAHGVRIKRGRAMFTNSIACGNGDVVGNGFFATHGAYIDCDNSTAHGNRNTGFIANRVSTLCAESCTSINNGNYQDEVDGGWVEREGKGFESEAGSNIYCQGSVAIYNNENGFYALAGSRMDARKCIGSAQLHGNGFYAIIGSGISSRYSIARNNAANGFYSNTKSYISADDTYAINNAVYDYNSGVNSDVSIDGILNTSATRNIVSSINRLTLISGRTLTISSGVITISESFHAVDTESSSVIDDLDTINGGSDGQIIILRTLNSGRDVVIKHGTGNIVLGDGNDKTLNDIKDRIALMYRGATATWHELFYSNNA